MYFGSKRPFTNFAVHSYFYNVTVSRHNKNVCRISRRQHLVTLKGNQKVNFDYIFYPISRIWSFYTEVSFGGMYPHSFLYKASNHTCSLDFIFLRFFSISPILIVMFLCTFKSLVQALFAGPHIVAKHYKIITSSNIIIICCHNRKCTNIVSD